MSVSRLESIDVLRALTMLLMVFVIDAESVSDVPSWLGHVAYETDGMGVADVVFPCFLFVVGLSIPYAMKARLAKGGEGWRVLLHVLARTVSLVVMGLYVVNMDSMQDVSMPIGNPLWQFLLVVAVFLVWNMYPISNGGYRVLKIVFQAVGVALLGFLAYVYEGPDGGWMEIRWWGILALIGWSYGLCSIVYLGARRSLIALGLVALLFLVLNVNEFTGWFRLNLLVGASNYFCVMAGVFCSALLLESGKSWRFSKLASVFATMAILLIVFGFATRPEWGISKIKATPSWSAICVGISLLCYVVLAYVCDVRKWVNWAKPFAAGGYAALSCYFALYFVYSIIYMSGWWWPTVFTAGAFGLLKSLTLAVFVIQLVGLFSKVGIRLRV